MNIVDKILFDPITKGLKFFTKSGQGGLIPRSGNQYITHSAAGTTYSFISGNQVGSTTAGTVTGDTVCTFANSSMQLTAVQKCAVRIDWTLFATSQLARIYLGKNAATTASAVQFSARNWQANDCVSLATSVVLQPGDFLTFCLDTGNIRSSSDIAFLNIVCQQIA